jgi:ribonuclease Y
MNPIIISVAIGTVLLAIAIVYAVKTSRSADSKIKNAEKEVADIIENANREAERIKNRANQDSQRLISKSRSDMDSEIKSRRDTVAEIEKRIMQKEQYFQEKETHLLDRDEKLAQEMERVKQLKRKQEDIITELLTKLEKVAGLSKEEASKTLLANVEKEVRARSGKMIKQIEEQARKVANRKAKEIVVDAIQRTAVDHVIEATTSVLQLPDDEMKGRIIGKEGRNIRAFESITGVDVVIDDTPGAVVLSCFDPIRREIARMTMEKLLQDGRIHPARIEEMVEKSKKELEEIIKDRGERAADELGLQFHPDIIRLLGKLHYRTSYGQNILSHSLEAAHIAGAMAAQLKVNVQLAKRGTVLHDIGKAIDFEQGGSHDDLGKEICEKYGESPEVINCIMAHHEDEEPDTIEAVLVMMADAISSVRPGARRESTDMYIKRLEKLEAIALSYNGVEKAYAIQAGRELRVVVKPEEIDDDGIHKIALDMAKQIESEVDYPGEVIVSIIREMRASGIAH